MIEVRLGDLFLIIDMRRKRMYVFRTDFSKCPLLLEKYSREKKIGQKFTLKLLPCLVVCAISENTQFLHLIDDETFIFH